MNCDKFDNDISFYIDNELSDIEKKEFELHFMKCEKCRKKYESMISVLKIVRADEQVELPEGYRETLKGKLLKASREQRKTKNWKLMASIAASLLVLFTSYELIYNNNIFNLNKSDSSLELEQGDEMYKTSDAEDKTMTMAQKKPANKDNKSTTLMDQEPEKFSAGTQASIVDNNNKAVEFKGGNANIYGIQATRGNITNRKTVKEAHIDIDAEEFDDASKEIIDFINANNGFVESVEIENNQEDDSGEVLTKRKIMKIRVPQDKFEQTVSFIKDIGILRNVRCSISDVTEKYINVESNLANLYDREFILEEVLDKVEDAEDIQLIEDEINKVKDEVNNYSGVLHKIDDSVMLSTINTTLNESADE